MMRNLMLFFLLTFNLVNAQDSIITSNLKIEIPENNWGRKIIAPTILFGASAATWGEREHIREIRNRYIPTFKVGYDDYLQYAPAATVYGLKIAGVKGRNNTLRATFSYASSLAIMGIIVNTIKHTANVERPDGSANNSFPSGHTSMAFTNASFLHKEYGVINPLYSIGGYSAATFTGLGRNLNNRHWISDVLAGAGIGILSTELGYFFIDKIYKNKGDNIGLLSRVKGNDHPSFLALKLGPAFATTNFLKESKLDEEKEIGFEAGLEGAFFFSKKWGIGADFTFSSFPVTPVRFELDDSNAEYFDVITQSLGSLNFGVGPYFAHQIDDHWELMIKSAIGYTTGTNGKILLKNESIPTANKEFEIATYKPTNSIRLRAGSAITYKFNPQLGVTAYADYVTTSSKINYDFNSILEDDEMDDELNAQVKEKMNFISLGLKLTAYF